MRKCKHSLFLLTILKKKQLLHELSLSRSNTVLSCNFLDRYLLGRGVIL